MPAAQSLPQLTDLINALTGLINAANTAGSTLQDLLNQLGGLNPVQVTQQAQTLAASGTANQLSFLSSLQPQSPANIKAVVDELMSNGLDAKMTAMVSKLQMQYDSTSSATEKKAILGHLENLRKLSPSVTDIAKQALITPFRDPVTGNFRTNRQTGQALTSADIAKLVSELSTTDDINAAHTRGDSYSR